MTTTDSGQAPVEVVDALLAELRHKRAEQQNEIRRELLLDDRIAAALAGGRAHS